MTAGRVARALWLLAAAAVLAVALASPGGGRPGDAVVVVLYAMLALSFPASLLVAGVFAALVALQDGLETPLLDLVASERAGLVLVWSAFTVAGYAQWFWLLPRIVHRLAGRWRGRSRS